MLNKITNKSKLKREYYKTNIYLKAFFERLLSKINAFVIKNLLYNYK